MGRVCSLFGESTLVQSLTLKDGVFCQLMRNYLFIYKSPSLCYFVRVAQMEKEGLVVGLFWFFVCLSVGFRVEP